MNTAYDNKNPTHLRERADALEALQAGKPLQCLGTNGLWLARAYPGEPLDSTSRYRPKPWTLPEPPAGMRWHKPEAITEDMHKEGWRPFLIGENGEGQIWDGESWYDMSNKQANVETLDMHAPCRTLRPLPSLMPGPEYHNPDQVSIAQVGEGYRLLTKEEQRECIHRARVHKGMSIWSIWSDHNTWSDADTSGMCEECTYRVPLNWQPSKPAPQPEPRPWDCPSDVPLVCWMRKRAVQPKSYGKLVVHVIDYGVFLYDEYAGWASMEDYEYSTDRQHWQPCHKATEAQS